MNEICIFDVNIWNFETCYFQGCLSPCIKISENLKHTIFRTVCLSVRSCGEAASVPRPGEPHLLNCRCLQVTSILYHSLCYLLLDGFERTNSVCKVTLLQNNLFLHSPSLYVGAEASLFLSLLSCCCVPFLFPDFTSEKRKLFVLLDVHSIEWKGNFANKKPNFAKQTSGYCSKPLSFTLYQQDVRHSHSRPLQFALLKTTFGPVLP